MGVGGVEGLGAALAHVVFDDAREQDECQKPNNDGGNDGNEMSGKDGLDPLHHGGERVRGHNCCGEGYWKWVCMAERNLRDKRSASAAYTSFPTHFVDNATRIARSAVCLEFPEWDS